MVFSRSSVVFAVVVLAGTALGHYVHAPQQQYGGYQAPYGGYQAPAPQQQYGPRPAPQQQYGPRHAPQQQYGPRPAPQQQYGPGPAPQQQYGPRPAPPQQYGGYDDIIDQIPAVTQTVTFTVFGPVTTVTEHSVLTRTQMFNGGITSDVRFTHSTSVTKTFNIENTTWKVEGDTIQTTTTLTAKTIIESLTIREAGSDGTQTITLTPTETTLEFVTRPGVVTHTFTAKSTSHAVSVVLVPMTTTIYQTVTRTHVAVENKVITITRPAPPTPLDSY